MNFCDPLSAYADELTALLQSNLREALFVSRAYLRPSDVRQTAVVQTNALFDFLRSSETAVAQQHGAYLCEIGVGDQAVLQTGEIMRRFCASHLHGETLVDCLPRVDEYHRMMVQGYFRAQESSLLEEQERIRSALQQTLHQYNVQLETAAEVARTTVSTLELDVLLNTAVELICQRYGLDYVGIYLTDRSGEAVSLKASSGNRGGVANRKEHHLAISGGSTVGRCITAGRNILTSRSAESVNGEDSSWVGGSESELSLPLITGERILGALTVQSADASAFSSLHVAGFQIVTDQLANAIQNANLYADARRRADELAAAYEQLKELELLKDQFMQNISHELRTPLTMIRGYAELMASSQLGTLDADQLDAVDVILRYSNALTLLVDDIMAIMDVSTSKSTNQPVALAELLSISLLDFQVLATGAGVHLVSDIDENDPQPVIYANPDHLRRIVENLIGNAVKFTPAGGKVRVQLDMRDGQAIISVSDNGIGIPPEMLPHVFDRFFQVDGSRKRRHGGVGLGLALVKELVESYGGWVTADSLGIDRGSTFRVALPVVTQ